MCRLESLNYLDLLYDKSASSLMFWKRCTFWEVINNKKFGGTTKCHARTNDVGEAPQYKLCKNNVHLICGNPEGDDGYDQLVVCFTCSKKGL